MKTQVRGKTRATARNAAWIRADPGHGQGQGKRLVETRARPGAKESTGARDRDRESQQWAR